MLLVSGDIMKTWLGIEDIRLLFTFHTFKIVFNIFEQLKIQWLLLRYFDTGYHFKPHSRLDWLLLKTGYYG